MDSVINSVLWWTGFLVYVLGGMALLVVVADFCISRFLRATKLWNEFFAFVGKRALKRNKEARHAG